ncbi:flagellar assembly protein FliH [Metabacillus sp. KIGAM252]|uniref:Flagellar assembly protein FliH n=1 Tax=Metabacillus flavus TaxID=2823519 RepID=A0ABS5LE03_9BACI|nr:flagellar assembly protein FliH [Metabacillus flavus]MBS2968983.1 flagellar assembly protein FliH [Metabacillus flavus]
MSKLIKSRFSSQQTKSAAIVPIMKMEDPLFTSEVMEETEQIKHAKRESEQIIRSAKAEEESIFQSIEMAKQNWELEKMTLEEQARESGYQEGLTYGRQDGYQQFSQAIYQANQLVELSRADYLEKVESAEETVVALAVKMAEKIIASSLNEKPDQMNEIVKQLLKEVKDYDEIKIFVHPDRYEYVRSQKDELKQLLTNEQELFLYMDEGLSPFDCFVETSFGRIDASVDTQLKQLEKQLLERLGEAESS